jgi:hypothetical protein
MPTHASLDTTVTKITKGANGEQYSGAVNFSFQLGDSGFGYQVPFDNKPSVAKAVEDAIGEVQSAISDLSQEVSRLNPLHI